VSAPFQNGGFALTAASTGSQMRIRSRTAPPSSSEPTETVGRGDVARAVTLAPTARAAASRPRRISGASRGPAHGQQLASQGQQPAVGGGNDQQFLLDPERARTVIVDKRHPFCPNPALRSYRPRNIEPEGAPASLNDPSATMI
jgi:hypothetical protein